MAICGLGNVAVDCARILLQNPARLESTDIAEHALDQLRSSAVRSVHLIGRRGVAQVSWVLRAVASCELLMCSSQLSQIQQAKHVPHALILKGCRCPADCSM